MICSKEKYIYTHVPKCAGNSIKDFLNIDGHSHRPLSKEIGQHHDYFSFSFVRNPWDRLVSAYNYLKKGGINYTSKNKQNKSNKFYKFMCELDGLVAQEINKYNDFEDFLYGDFFKKQSSLYFSKKMCLHFLPQTFFIDTDIDFIGKVESINEDMKYVAKKIGRETKPIKNLNKIDRPDYKQFYNLDTIDFVANIYLDDILKFNYEFS